jgi:hypothetical protein
LFHIAVHPPVLSGCRTFGPPRSPAAIFNRPLYAQLLINEIPPKKRLDVFIDAYKIKENGEPNKLAVFFSTLLKQLGEDEKQEVYKLISNEMRTTTEESTIRTLLQVMPSDCWNNYAEDGRMRIENKLIEAIRTGKYSSTNDKCLSGALGTWTPGVWQRFTMKQQLVEVLATKLSSELKADQDYVFKYFFHSIETLVDPPPTRIVYVVNKALKAGDKRFYDAVASMMVPPCSANWEKAFQTAFDNFKEAEPTPEDAGEDDNIPF